MENSASHIGMLYRQITGAALLVVYLVGSAFSIYSAFHQNHSGHTHHSQMHCSTTLCTCSHEDGECTCNQSTSNTKDHLTYEQCPTPIADFYTGHSFSSFITESLTPLVKSITEKPLPLPPTANVMQHIIEPPLDPPRLA